MTRTTLLGCAMLSLLCLFGLARPSNTRETAAEPRQQQQGGWTVWATREGLVGKRTATGFVITKEALFVGLPDRSALNRRVTVTYQGKSITVPVRDVGPHNTIDPYWEKDGTPAAARGERLGKMARYGKPKNNAGIDLSDGLWDALGIPRRVGIVTVTWCFQ